jgi:hypothetical protein
MFSLECGVPVSLAKKPDMYVEEVPVEVKSLSWDTPLSTLGYTQKIIDRAAKAFQVQQCGLVGLDIGIALTMLGLAKKESSGAEEREFCTALKNSLALAKNGGRPVLLFYYDPWTGDVQARAYTLEGLKS